MNTFKRALLTAALAAPLFAGDVSAQWALTGNAVGATDFLGTTNAQDFRIRTNNTERARITSGGLIGIGTTSPAERLTVHFHSEPQLRLEQPSTDSWEMWAGTDFHIRKVTGTVDWLNINTGSNFLRLGPASQIHVNTSLHRTGIGTTSPVSALTVAGNVAPTSDGGGDVGAGFARRWNQVWACNGTINTSDAREKENIRNIGYGLSAVLRLHPVSFTWKYNPDQGTKLGLLAQELEQVIPEVVKTAKDDSKGVFYSDLIPVLVKALQEQEMNSRANADIHTGLRETSDRQDARLAALESALGADVDAATVRFDGPVVDGALGLSYHLPTSVQKVEVVAFNVVKGDEVERIVLDERGEGSRSVAVAGAQESGTYLYTVVADGKLIASRKIVVE